MTEDPVLFVTKVWALQRTDGKAWGFFAKKNWSTGSWKDYPTQTPGDISLPDYKDLYFTPCVFTKARRVKENCRSSRILYCDLDEVDPTTIKDIPPSIAWETSPGRYQALWVLDRSLPYDRFERLNKRLTYFVGADKGGWACVKVLRPPGSISTKYGSSRAKRFTVKLVDIGPRKKYKLENLMQLLPRAERTGNVNVSGIFGGSQSLPSRDRVLDKWADKLPMRAKRLLRAKGAQGDDRSARLWELYNLLLQTGVPPNHILVLVKDCAFNKYKGQRRELVQLQSEIAKAAEKHAASDEMARLVGATRTSKNSKTLGKNGNGRKGPKLRGALAKQAEARAKKNPKELPYLTEEEFMQMHFPKPEWLVEGFWSKGAYGVCVGEYKAFKTTILLNMAVSVASGTSFLEESRFEVKDPGLVLYLHEEGRQGSIQGLLHRIKARKGLAAQVQGRHTLTAPQKIPLHVSSFTGFKLSDPKCQEQLVRYIERRKPKLIIMESWYLIASEIDENKAGEVGPILDWITKISQDFGCAMIISHHYNKDKENQSRRAIDRVSGSGVFGRWFESMIALERYGAEENYEAVIEAHHREQKGIPRQTLRIEMEGDDEDDFNVTLVDSDVEVTDTGTNGHRAEERDAIEYVVARMEREKPLNFSKVKNDLDMEPDELKSLLETSGYRVVWRKKGNRRLQIIMQ